MANQRPVMSPLSPAIGACLARSFMQAVLAAAACSAIRAGFVHNDFYRALILPFKYGDALHLTLVLGRFVTRHFATMNDPGSLVIPIPLHRHHYLLC